LSSSGTRIGTTIAGYRLEALLGRGGMSVVYRAEQVRLGRTVALKLLAEALTNDPSFRERFERESRHAAEIDHPNIIPIYDAGEAEGQLFIAMKWVRGTDLRTIIEHEGALGVGRTLLYLQQAAAALDAAHDRNLIHRDVKPANILVEQPSERVYLSDFGIVKHTASPGMTRTGVFVGTVDYASPEQIEGLTVDARADVYALGCVLFECLAGRAPFGRESEVAVMHAHLAEPPPSLHEARPDLPRSLDRVIGIAMSKSADDRYGSCEELMTAVQAAADERASSATRGGRVPTNGGAREAAASVPAAFPPTIVDEPPQAPPPRDPGSPRRGGGGVPGWIPVVGAMLIGALIAVIVALFLTRDNGGGGTKTVVLTDTTGASASVTTATTSTGSTGTGTATTGTGTTTVAIDPATTQIGKVVPQTILKDCTLADTATNGAMETANCSPPAGAGAQFYPTSWTLSVYPSSEAMLAAYDQLLATHKLTNNKGSCNGVSWGGAGPWLHGPGKPGGRRLCFFQGGHAVIVWTHEKLGQADHIDFLGRAEADDLDHPELFSWWRFWHHRMGKLLPGISPS
jgi:predicted Ser/Thr protein kinase